MKSGFSRHVLLAIATLLGIGNAGVAAAHNQGGALGKSSTAADIYEVACSNDSNGSPAALEARIKDIAPVAPPLVTVQIQKNSVTVTSADSVDGDRKFSPLVGNSGGEGVYIVTVSKTVTPGKPVKRLAYKEIYLLEYHCVTASDAHTGTEIGQKQNQ